MCFADPNIANHRLAAAKVVDPIDVVVI